MNPKKANQELNKKITLLNDVFQKGRRANEFAKTEYWQELKEMFDRDIKDSEELKKLTPLETYLSGFPLHNSEGKSVGFISGQQALVNGIKEEIRIATIQSIIHQVEMDIEAGNEAYKELEHYKQTINK